MRARDPPGGQRLEYGEAAAARQAMDQREMNTVLPARDKPVDTQAHRRVEEMFA